MLRAQVQALTSGPDHIGQTKREIAQNASQAVASFRPEFPTPSTSGFGSNGSSHGQGSGGLSVGIPIDPSLTNDHEPPLRSTWDSSPRRGSDQFPLAPMADTLHSRTASFSGGTPATSLTRLVHDAALGTGHASYQHSGLNQPRSNASGSEKGSTTDSPIGPAQGIDLPDRPPSTSVDSPFPTGAAKSATLAAALSSTSQKSNHTNSPHSSTQSKPKRTFAIPPLPPQPAVERLVAAYVDFVGVTAPIIHIPTLGKQLIKIREGGPDVEQSDVFIVMMMLGETLPLTLTWSTPTHTCSPQYDGFGAFR